MKISKNTSRGLTASRIISKMQRLFFQLDFDLLLIWNGERLRELIVKNLLEPIRYHRDQRADDRCWFDDLTVYSFLPESLRRPIQLSVEDMASLCAHYHSCRGGDAAPQNSNTGEHPRQPNAYLGTMTIWQLRQEFRRLRAAIRKHKRVKMENRQRADDEKLYAALPDGVEADFRLPPEKLFLPNCRLICSMTDPNNVDLSTWPEGWRSPLADWHPDN